MNQDVLNYVLIGSLLIIMMINALILMRILNFKSNNEFVKKTLENHTFNQQTFYMNMQKSISEDFSKLRESLLLNVSKFNDQTVKEILSLQNKLNSDLYQNFERLNRNINQQMDQINERVELRLSEGFEKTTKTFNNVLERLSKIDEAQKKIESLSTNIISLQDILTDKKSRGTFGEIQLKQIFSSIFGDNNKKVYELQKKLSNGNIVDAILFTPEPLGNICVDSKFPLENYKRMIDKTYFNHEEAEKLFKQDVKNHINAIKNKYIVANETADSAIMFIPAEAVFAEINAYHQDLVEFSQKSKVWIASPTTLMFLLTTVQVILRNVERDKYASVIQEELNKLGVEFKRYKDRWDRLSRNIDQVSRNVKELYTTSDKIEKHFDLISNVDFKNESIHDQIEINLNENEEEES